METRTKSLAKQTPQKLVRTPSKIRQHARYGMRCSHAQAPTMCGWWVIPWGHKHSCELTQRIRYHGAHSGLHTPQHWIRKHRNSITTEHTITAGLRMNAYMLPSLNTPPSTQSDVRQVEWGKRGQSCTLCVCVCVGGGGPLGTLCVWVPNKQI